MRYKLEAGIEESRKRIASRKYCIEDELLVEAGERIQQLTDALLKIQEKCPLHSGNPGWTTTHEIAKKALENENG